jgi:hypothetical protein
VTLIFQRPAANGPVTRALVLGVGAYPDAQDPHNSIEVLRAVPQHVSSATSAALFTDWLIRNADAIEPPLASIDLLLCASAAGGTGALISTYVWTNRVEGPQDAIDPRVDPRVDPPTSAALKSAGAAWLAALRAQPGSHALFYGCGHGTNLPGKSMLLLHDLASDPADPWAHFDVSHHALAFDQIAEIGRATFFLDACAEDLDVLRRNSPGNGVRLANYFADKEGDRKVYALAAAAAPSLTFEGEVLGSTELKAGRFTQCLLRSLDGAAIRLMDGVRRWGVPHEALKSTIAQLWYLREEWQAESPLRPKVIEEPINNWSIVTPPSPIMVPLCVDVLPESDTPEWALSVYSTDAPKSEFCLHSRPSGAYARWVVQVPVATQRYALVAERAQPETSYIVMILPTQALFDLRVPQ